MRDWCWLLVCVAALGVTPGASAETGPDALQWLQKVATSARRLNYSGVFVYQEGGHSEASRIAHLVENGRELERIETLDDNPREVVREGDEIKCYIPDQRLLVVERSKGRRSFPAVLPERIATLSEHYNIRRGPPGRVAGWDTHTILVDPKDEFRYRRQFWVETQSGLMLKASLLDEAGGTRESFAFTEVRIGGPVDRESLKAHVKLKGGDWRVHDARSREMPLENDAWVFRTSLPGFIRISGMKRKSQQDGNEVTHLVYSDGLAAISIFIKPLRPDQPRPDAGVFAMGAVNVYKRFQGDHLMTALGDVPQAALVKLVDGIEARRK